MKILFGISDHTLDHFAADAACLAGGQIAVVTLLQIDIQGRSDFALERLQLALGFIGRIAGIVIACHVFHLLAGFVMLNFCKVRTIIIGKKWDAVLKQSLNHAPV